MSNRTYKNEEGVHFLLAYLVGYLTGFVFAMRHVTDDYINSLEDFDKAILVLKIVIPLFILLLLVIYRIINRS